MGPPPDPRALLNHPPSGGTDPPRNNTSAKTEVKDLREKLKAKSGDPRSPTSGLQSLTLNNNKAVKPPAPCGNNEDVLQLGVTDADRAGLDDDKDDNESKDNTEGKEDIDKKNEETSKKKKKSDNGATKKKRSENDNKKKKSKEKTKKKKKKEEKRS